MSPSETPVVVVHEVLDGRTIALSNGVTARISLLAPPADCWAREALQFARNTLLARTVRVMSTTPGEVSLVLGDGTDFALLAVQSGVLRVQGADGGPFLDAERAAARANVGLWGPPCEGMDLTTPAPPTGTTPPEATTATEAPVRPAPVTTTTAALTTTTTRPPARTCAVAYRVTAQWPGGFQASVTVRNTGGTEINGWSLRWTFAEGQTVRDMWNATPRQSGATVTAVNASYNPRIAPGGSVQIGFNGTSRGSTPAPGAFTLNGSSCEVQ